MHHFGFLVLIGLAILGWVLLGPTVAVYLAASLVGSLLGVVLDIWTDGWALAEARIKRTIQSARLGEALRLPEWPPREREIDQFLRNALVIGRTAGIPAEMADRLGATAVQHVDREVSNLLRLANSAQSARIGLAELTLSGGEILTASSRWKMALLRSPPLGEAARERAVMAHEGVVAEPR